MAVYTEFLSDLIVNMLLDRGFSEETIKSMSIEDRVETVAPYIFQSFPIFDEEYRLGLEKKILYHYYMREIGQETEQAFIFYLNRTLNEEMPYFNKLYESELLDFNPLWTIHTKTARGGSGTTDTTRADDFTREDNLTEKTESKREDDLSQVSSEKRSDSSKSSEFSSGSDEGKDYKKSGYLDTPQGSISAIGDALSDTGSGYLSNATMGEGQSAGVSSAARNGESESGSEYENATYNGGTQKGENEKKNTGTQTNSGSQAISAKTVNDYLDEVTGYTGSPSKLIMEFRDTFLNLDMRVIDSLASCFMEIY